MQKNSDYFSMEEAKRLSQSPAARQLLALMQQKNSADAAQAMRLASAGDYAGASRLLSSLLADPQARALLQQLGGR